MDNNEIRLAIKNAAQRLANIQIPCGLIKDIGLPIALSIQDLQNVLASLHKEETESKEQVKGA